MIKKLINQKDNATIKKSLNKPTIEKKINKQVTLPNVAEFNKLASHNIEDDELYSHTTYNTEDEYRTRIEKITLDIKSFASKLKILNQCKSRLLNNKRKLSRQIKRTANAKNNTNNNENTEKKNKVIKEILTEKQKKKVNPKIISVMGDIPIIKPDDIK